VLQNPVDISREFIDQSMEASAGFMFRYVGNEGAWGEVVVTDWQRKPTPGNPIDGAPRTQPLYKWLHKLAAATKQPIVHSEILAVTKAITAQMRSRYDYYGRGEETSDHARELGDVDGELVLIAFGLGSEERLVQAI
jgi:hypothetical protein